MAGARHISKNSNGSRQIIDHIIGRDFIFKLGAITRAHEKSQSACHAAHFDVAGLVANHNAVGHVEAQIVGRFLQQAELRLATSAIIVRCMRTHVKARLNECLPLETIPPDVDERVPAGPDRKSHVPRQIDL